MASRCAAAACAALILAACDAPEVSAPPGPETGTVIVADQPRELRGTPLMPAEGPQPRIGHWADPEVVASGRQPPLILFNGIVIDDPEWVLTTFPAEKIDSIKVIKGVVAQQHWGPAGLSGAIAVFATPLP